MHTVMYVLVALLAQAAAAAASYVTAPPTPAPTTPTPTPTVLPRCTRLIAQTATAAPVCSQVPVPGVGCGWLCRTVVPQNPSLVPCNQFVGCRLYQADPKTGGVLRCKRRRATSMPCTPDFCCVKPAGIGAAGI